MPIRAVNPFADPTLNMRGDVNVYLQRLRAGLEDGQIPVRYGPVLQKLPGRWREEMRTSSGEIPQSLVLEIGCHHGDTLVEMAALEPDTGFIGMDITFKRVVKTANRAKSRGFKNMMVVLANAKALPEMFAKGELDGVAIFYPDPWERKKRQQKNRLINAEFAQSLHDALKENGFFWFRTDHYGYFVDVTRAVQGAGFISHPAPSGILKASLSTCFESHFQAAGRSTFSAIWVKTPK